MTVFGIFSIFLTLSGAVILLEIGEPTIAFATAIFGFLIFDAVAWDRVVRDNRISFALKVAFCVGAVSKLFPIAMCATLVLQPDQPMPWGDAIYPMPITAALGGAAANISLTLVLLVCQYFLPAYEPPKVAGIAASAGSSLELSLIVAGVIKLLYWVAVSDFSNPFFYIIRRLDSALTLVPFLVGLTSQRCRISTIFWMVVMAIGLIVAVLTGSRGKAFIPIGFFLVGYVLSLVDWRARIDFAIFYLTPAILFLLFAAVYIEVARDIGGRTHLSDVLTDGTLLKRIENINLSDEVDSKGGILYRASRRLTAWPPYVVPTMSPEPIPFRGFDDLSEELSATTSFRFGTAITSGQYYLANLHLKPYGFAVHVNAEGVKTSNVGMPMFVDGFTRAGWLGGVLYCLFGYTTIVIIEIVARGFLLPNYVPVFLVVLCTIANPYNLSVSGLTTDWRQLILESILVTVVFSGVHLIQAIRQRSQ